ncbi:GPR1/FUN34/YaaH family transporter [Pseudonocardia sp. GCM10023141]|uniref:GPR1/FUN34/YaaH family transporter n=1 Tax=Pseudonocardia sp. GCM10023141 TaxID=3252653 RepID=UPI00362336D0
MSVDSETTSSTAAVAAAPPANPGLLGLPCFVAGGIGLSLYLLGYLPATGLGALVPIVLFVPGLGLIISGIWAMREGQSAVGSIFGLFGAFWISYGMLVFGLVSGVLKVDAAAANAAQATFLTAWLVAFVCLTVSTLRLPLAFTVMFVLVTIAVALVLLAVLTGSAGLLTIAGIVGLLFSLDGAYIYIGSMSAELGGKGLGLGNPMVH